MGRKVENYYNVGIQSENNEIWKVGRPNQQVITIMGEGKDGKNSQETIIFLISFSKWALKLLKYIYIQKETSMFKNTQKTKEIWPWNFHPWKSQVKLKP